MSKKKQRQHYVPRFYLRNFSSSETGKDICLFNTTSSIFIQKAPIKTQAYKPFFYGEDGEIEEALSKIENEMAPIIQSVSSSAKLPLLHSKEWFTLLQFAILMSLRNPIATTNILESSAQLKNTVNGIMGQDMGLQDLGFTNHLEAVHLSLKHISMLVAFCSDLKPKLLLNKTGIPFITSDNPLVKYNQFLEQRKWPLSSTGYSSLGLQLFLPINPKVILLFYDENVYKVGFKKDDSSEIVNSKTVDSINILQLLNCNSQVFFGQETTESYIRKLFSLSASFEKPNKAKTDLFPATVQFENKTFKDQFIRQSASEAKIGLSIENILITKKGKKIVPGNKAVLIRPATERIFDHYGLNQISKFTFPKQ